MHRVFLPSCVFSFLCLLAGFPIAYAQQPSAIISAESPPEQILTLQEAWQRVKTHNPALQASAFAIKAAQGQQVQAQVIPNPNFSYTLEQVQGTGEYSNMQMAQSTFLVSEPIELGGKRAARKAVAGSEYEATKNNNEANLATMFSLTSDAFLTVAEAKAQWQLSQKTAAVNQQIVDTIQRRVQAGRSSALELKTAQIALADQQLSAKVALQALNSSYFNLTNLWGGETTKSFEVSIPTIDSMPLASLDFYHQQLVQNPELQTALAIEKTEKAQLKLTEAKAVPDVSLGAGVQHFNQTHDDAYVAEVAIPIPLFDRNQGNTASALANYDKALEETQNKKNHLSAKLFDLYQNAAQALFQTQTLKQTILPNAENALALAQQGYEQGRFSYLELLSTQQKLTDERLRYLSAEFAYRRNWIALQVLTGQLPKE